MVHAANKCIANMLADVSKVVVTNSNQQISGLTDFYLATLSTIIFKNFIRHLF